MRVSLAAATLGLAIAAATMSRPQAYAQRGPETYPLCALNRSGATECYFDSRAECDSQGDDRCIENPGYIGPGNAMARAASGRSHKTRR
jgi:hypothetical protein